jgi:hypothetical protein
MIKTYLKVALCATALCFTAPAAFAGDTAAPPCDSSEAKDGVLGALNTSPFMIANLWRAIRMQIIVSDDPDATPADHRRHCTGIMTMNNSYRMVVDYEITRLPDGGLRTSSHPATYILNRGRPTGLVSADPWF